MYIFLISFDLLKVKICSKTWKKMCVLIFFWGRIYNVCEIFYSFMGGGYTFQIIDELQIKQAHY